MDEKIIIYQMADGETSIDVKLERETVWLSANQMSELFGRDAKTIRKHINNVFSEGELAAECNTQKMRVPLSDKPVPFYSLDVIISVGYRVKSQRRKTRCLGGGSISFYPYKSTEKENGKKCCIFCCWRREMWERISGL